MNKTQLQHLILAQLQADLALTLRAAQSAHEAATHEENIAENKYDTLGLEASYLAAGQARRVEQIRQALAAWEGLRLRPFDGEQGIQLGTLVWLADARGSEQCLLLGPDGAGLKVTMDGQEVRVISPRAPLGQRLIGCGPGDEIEIRVDDRLQRFEVLQAE